jgi:hypothetical protein
MEILRTMVNETLMFFRETDLLSTQEVDEILSVLSPDFPFAKAVGLADSVHVHVKVSDVAQLPHSKILASGTKPENQKHGYVKYPFASGINMIFSSIDVAQEDLVATRPRAARPCVDHIGIDLRTENPETTQVFDDVPRRAITLGWRHVPQGGHGTPVYCCHVRVGAKHWIYPPVKDATFSRPLEFALGPLTIDLAKSGCDLRPIDPGHPAASRVPSCAACGRGN